jgi:aquaporin Z
VALCAGEFAISQIWLFWLAPIVGAILGAVVYRLIGGEDQPA